MEVFKTKKEKLGSKKSKFLLSCKIELVPNMYLLVWAMIFPVIHTSLLCSLTKRNSKSTVFTADFEVTQNALGQPVGMTLKLDFNGRQADGRALSF